MSVAPHAGIIDFGTFTSPTASQDGIQGEVPAPLSSEIGYALTTEGWAPFIPPGSLGSMAYQNADAVAITGGTINGTTIGATTASTGKFTSVTTPSVTATTTDLTLSANGANSIYFGYGSGTALQLRDNSQTACYPLIQSSGTTIQSYASSSGSNVGYQWVTKGVSNHSFATNASAGNEQLRVSHTASAVNYVQVTGGATTGRPIISAQGSDTNISIGYDAKNAGGHNFKAGGNTQVLINNSASAVNSLNLTGSATTQAIPLSATGTDTNISMAFQPKGTGAIDLAAGSSGVNISNGGTVTAITRTAAGTGYTTNPTVTISAPTTAGGVQATATCTLSLQAAPTIVSGGTGYTVNDVLTLSGGTFTTATQVTVSAVSGGVITAITLTTNGIYTTVPANNISVTGGTGTGATFSTTAWGVSSTFTITAAGSGYIEQPTITFSSGAATAYATVGSDTVVRSLGTNMLFYTPNQQICFRVTDNAGASGNGYWSVFGGSTSPILRAIASSNARIEAASAVPISFYTNSGTAGAQQMAISHTASAVNYVQVTGAATTATPTISAQGSDTNVSLTLVGKGSGGVKTSYFHQIGTSYANYISISGNATTVAPTITAAGTDTNINLALTPKGTGTVQFGTYTAGVLSATGYITITDSGGTTRRLLVG